MKCVNNADDTCIVTTVNIYIIIMLYRYNQTQQRRCLLLNNNQNSVKKIYVGYHVKLRSHFEALSNIME